VTIENQSSHRRIIEQAISQLNRKNDEKALRFFDQAINKGLNLPGLNYGKAIACARMGRVNEAVNLLKNMLIHFPNHKKAHQLLDELNSSIYIDFREKITPNNSIKEQKSSIWLPKRIYPDDVFIVSYPKSGNTWLRFLLANLVKLPGEEIDFHTVHKYIPEVGEEEGDSVKLIRPRMMKSHACRMTEYPRVVYLIRDGRDVYVSYYFHRIKQLSPDTTFRKFIERQDHYPSTWGEHIKSWLFCGCISNLLIVRYEDLFSDILNQLKRIVGFIGIELTEKQLKIAIENSKFENMRRVELEKGRKFKNNGPDIFTRSGKPGDWKKYFGMGEKRIFKLREGPILIKLGYEINKSW
jgi:tetratricopeptide (TPR) repeat protein